MCLLFDICQRGEWGRRAGRREREGKVTTVKSQRESNKVTGGTLDATNGSGCKENAERGAQQQQNKNNNNNKNNNKEPTAATIHPYK
jgi:hypothetical protein